MIVKLRKDLQFIDSGTIVYQLIPSGSASQHERIFNSIKSITKGGVARSKF